MWNPQVYIQLINIKLHSPLSSPNCKKKDAIIKRLHKPRLKSAQIFVTPTSIQIPRVYIDLLLKQQLTPTSTGCKSSGCKSPIKTKTRECPREFSLKLTKIKFNIHFLSYSSHISSAKQSHVACVYCIEWCGSTAKIPVYNLLFL